MKEKNNLHNLLLELTNDKNENIVTYIKFEKFYRGKNIINKININILLWITI